jgi:hypothetical protein
MRTHVTQIVATKLASLVVKTIAERPGLIASEKMTPEGPRELEGRGAPRTQTAGTDLAVALTERLANEAILEMVETVRELEPERGGSILYGDLGVVPIGAILQLLQSENQTGVLVCKYDGAEVRATFRGGLIDIVQSSGAGDEFRLGRFFIEEGIVTTAEIDEIMKSAGRVLEPPPPPLSDPHARVTMPSAPPIPLAADSDTVVQVRPTPDVVITEQPERTDRAQAGAPPRRLGTMLLAAGKITPLQLKTALVRQSSELLYEVLRWPKGRFDFRRFVEPAEGSEEGADETRLGLPVASVVMEGFRRVDEWRALERTLGNWDEVLLRDDAVVGTLATPLPERERRLLDLVDGERSIRKLIADSHMSNFDACRVLVQFLEARVLRRRSG